MKQIRKRLTYANVMSSVAVFLVLGGATAVAAKKIGTQQLKPNSVTTAKIKRNAVTTRKIKRNAVTTNKIRSGAITTDKIGNNAVTGEKVDEGTLGTVPSANTANSANTAKVADSLAGMTPFKLTKVLSSASGVDAAAAAAAATPVILYEDDHFTLYGKCFIDSSAPVLQAVVYIAAKQDGAIFDSDDDELIGNAPDGYLNPGTPEDLREVISDATTPNEAGMQYEGNTEFGATAASGYTIQGVNMVAEKFGTPAAGNGPYGAGNVCLFSGYVLHS